MAPHERHWNIGNSLETLKPALRKPALPANQNRGLAALQTQLQVVVPRAANRMVSLPARTAGSTVAIDNKIEQAMDLVKSHLMYAVREEVEVLKERIAELLDRISVLETENSILKASAPQEVLAELSSAVEDQHYNSQSSPAPPQGPPSSTNN